MACRAGIDVVIAAGSKPGVVADVIEGKPVGTRFHALETPLENRKRWIFGAPPAGEITVDDGAVEAMMARGSSLLPKGIREVKGDFSRGEVIRIRNGGARSGARRQPLQQRCDAHDRRAPLAGNQRNPRL